MSSARPTLGAIPYRRLSDVDFEQPTAIIWPILALAALRTELKCFDAEYHSHSWNTYMLALNKVSIHFGLPNSPFNWGTLSGDLRRNLYRDLAEASAEFNRAYETGRQEELFCKYLLRWFEAYNTQLDIDIRTSLARISDYTQVFDVSTIRSGVATLMCELTGSIVERHLDALREVPTVSADAIHQVQELNTKCIAEILEAIKVYLIVKIDREYLGAQSLPTNFIDRVMGAIGGPFTEYVMFAYADYIKALGKGKGKYSEDANEHTVACMKTLFFGMGRAFSSSFILRMKKTTMTKRSQFLSTWLIVSTNSIRTMTGSRVNTDPSRLDLTFFSVLKMLK
jgi:hypothetical protein